MNTVRIIIILIFGVLSGAVAAKSTLVFATTYDEGTHQTINNRVFARDISRETMNVLDFDVHTNGSLYSGMALFEAVSQGEVDLGELILSSMGSLDPVFLVDNLPFVVSDFDAAYQLWLSTRGDIDRILAEHGVKLLYSTPWPPQGIYTNDVPTGAGDFAGMNIRSYSEMTRVLIEALNATPVEVPFSEVENAFSEGRIDAMITSVSTGVSSSAWQYTRVYTNILFWIPKNIVFMNASVFDQLTPEQQSTLLRSAEAAELRGWRLAQEEYLRSTISLTDNGIRVRTPRAALRLELEQIGAEITADWLSGKDDRIKALLNGTQQ